MTDFFYTLLVFPVEQIIQLCYSFALRVCRNPGLSIIGVSLAVSTLVLPIYLMAEKQQRAEREKQKVMNEEAGNIKAVFRGDKRYMLLSTLYRQNNYHPIYALRNSIDLFIQIPFFIAAYHFLHNLSLLNGQSFFMIKDLGAPDGLLGKINLLPVIMTLINGVSGAIYTKGLALKDKIQVYGIAAVFLILLYHSPSALVLYWICNNVYNLIKNILLKTKNAPKIIAVTVGMLAAALAVYVLFFHEGALSKRLLIAGLCIMAFSLPLWKRIGIFIKSRIQLKDTALNLTGRTFILSSAALLLLTGLVIPSSLIASSVAEFSFLEPFSSPLPFIGITLLQSAGILLWLVCIYYLFDRRIRILMAAFITCALGISILNTFAFNADYGFMTPDLHFPGFKEVLGRQKLINIVCILVVCVVMFKLLLWKKKEKVLFSLQSIIVASFLCFGIMNIVKINGEFNNTPSKDFSSDFSSSFEHQYTFTKTGKNMLVIMLDRAISGYVPYIFEEKPELLKSFEGFVYYPNTISFGGHTIYGAPGIFGGYYYTPLEIQRRANESWWDKYYESMRVLPRILAESGFSVTVHDQFDMDNRLYDKFENISAENVIGRYTDLYLKQFPDFNLMDYHKILRSNLIRFSFFKVSPLLFHGAIYDNGDYFFVLTDFRVNSATYSYSTISNYTSLYYLPDITGITDEDKNYSVMFFNNLTHEAAFMEAPYYKPSNNSENRGNGPFAGEDHYHVNMASFVLLAKWFDFLKKNGVYDNTRIIIVSDHGAGLHVFPKETILPNGHILEGYAALLMVKDFDAEFTLATDNSFMTNADVPHIAAAGIVHNVINPFTGKELVIDKNNGVTITTSQAWVPKRTFRYGYEYDIKNNEWLYVKDNIFDPANWSPVTIEK